MKNLVTLSIEEFLSLYNASNRGADLNECYNALERLYGRSFTNWSVTEAMVQFAYYINNKRPELKIIIDKLNNSYYIPNTEDDPSFKTSLEVYMKKAKELIKSSAVVVEKLTYKSNLNLRQEDVVTSYYSI